MTRTLMYHDVVPAGQEDTSGFPGRDAARYKVTPERFRDHLAAIAAAGAHTVLTFDDGGVSGLLAADLMEERGFRGLFFVTANYVGTPGFLTPAHLHELHVRGHRIGSHSCSHPLRIGHCSAEQLTDEWQRSADILSGIVGSPIVTASVPGGDFAPAVAESAARAGINLLFTSEPTARASRVHGVELHGRYTIFQSTSAATAAGLAQGAPLPCGRQAVVWSAKKAAKRIGGAGYLRLRKLLLGHGDEVRWGDAPTDRRTTTVREG